MQPTSLECRAGHEERVLRRLAGGRGVRSRMQKCPAGAALKWTRELCFSRLPRHCKRSIVILSLAAKSYLANYSIPATWVGVTLCIFCPHPRQPPPKLGHKPSHPQQAARPAQTTPPTQHGSNSLRNPVA